MAQTITHNDTKHHIEVQGGYVYDNHALIGKITCNRIVNGGHLMWTGIPRDIPGVKLDRVHGKRGDVIRALIDAAANR